MSDKLKKFVREHRGEFDTNEPSKDLFEKISARMEVKNFSRISSKWLSKFKYLGFSASVLVLAIYFIAKNLNASSPSDLVRDKKGSALGQPKPTLIAYQGGPVTAESDPPVSRKETRDPRESKHPAQGLPPVSLRKTEQHGQVTHNDLAGMKKDSIPDQVSPVSKSFETRNPGQEKIIAEASVAFLQREAGETRANSTNQRKVSDLTKNSKKNEIYIPADPEQMNTYTGTLYESSSLCAVLHAFRFPGRVNLDKGSSHRSEDVNYKTTVNTVSCARLENMSTIKAVWLKGRTNKEITLSVGKRFKNIVLVKRDGRESNPEAISHYYHGLGVISEFKGRHFNMVFKDKVELILFFNDVEEGDKVVIDGIIEAVIKNKP